MNLILAPGLLDEIIEDARKRLPDEGCGLIAGGRDMATQFLAMANIAASPASEFEIDPPALIQGMRQIREAGQSLLAIYHSHPKGPATPSKKDVARAYYPETAHL